MERFTAPDEDPRTGAASGTLIVPVTERILGRFGWPRWLLICLWALVPMLSLVVFATAIRLSGRSLDPRDLAELLTTQVVLSYACAVLLVGVGVVANRAAAVKDDLAGRVSTETHSRLFRWIGSAAGPLALTAIVAAIISANGWIRFGPVPPLAALPLVLVYVVPIGTFVWVYLAILVDVDRLGRQTIELDGFPEDRTLGLGKVGSLASVGLGLVLVAAVPVLLAGADQPTTLAIGLVIVAVTVATFVLSMWRLHRQMAAAKARYVDLARRLYADAYEPIRRSASVATLKSGASALGAAQSLEERARGLPTWPIDEGSLRFLAVIVTGVVTSLIVRGLFAAVGL